jgi:glycosyltransferase involved in cell wall biosynthesis
MHPLGCASVAVVIPAYNGQQYIEETLQSVLNQTLQPREIVVVDDASTDGTASIVRRFAPRVTLVTRQRGGVSATRNYGASITDSEWLTFLDQDDLWEPENLERQMAAIAASPEAGACYADRRILVQQPDCSFRYEPPSWPTPTPEELGATLLERCPFTPCSVLVHRDAFLSIGGFDGRHNGVEDWDFWLRLHFAGVRFTWCPEVLVAYRVHESNATRQALRLLSQSLGVVEQNIRPRLTRWQRLTKLRSLRSRLYADAALLMRENKTPGSFSLMLRSIARHPWRDRRRYRIAAHMLVTRLRRLRL